MAKRCAANRDAGAEIDPFCERRVPPGLILGIKHKEAEGRSVRELSREDGTVRRHRGDAARRPREGDVHEAVDTASTHERRRSQQVQQVDFAEQYRGALSEPLSREETRDHDASFASRWRDQRGVGGIHGNAGGRAAESGSDMGADPATRPESGFLRGHVHKQVEPIGVVIERVRFVAADGLGELREREINANAFVLQSRAKSAPVAKEDIACGRG